MQPTLNQISFLLRTLKNDNNIPDHWEVDSEDFCDGLHKMTIGQYTYILTLLPKRGYIKINEIFQTLNLPRNICQTK